MLSSLSRSRRRPRRPEDARRVRRHARPDGQHVRRQGARAKASPSTVAVKGDRKATINDTTGQIVDLAEEKIYDLDLKKKSYKVTTFAELRRRMEEAQKKAEEDARKEAGAREGRSRAAARSRTRSRWRSTSTSRTPATKKTINGFDTHEVVMTITVREKGKTLEQSGGMVMTVDMWLAPKIAAMKEIADFDMRYAQKLYGPMIAGVSAEQMAAAMAMYPMMKQALGKMSAEGGKIEGTPILTTTTMDAVKSAEQHRAGSQGDERDSKPSASGGVSGLLGGFAKKMAQKKMRRRRRRQAARDVHDDDQRSAEGGHRRRAGGRRGAGGVQREQVGTEGGIGRQVGRSGENTDVALPLLSCLSVARATRRRRRKEGRRRNRRRRAPPASTSRRSSSTPTSTRR